MIYRMMAIGLRYAARTAMLLFPALLGSVALGSSCAVIAQDPEPAIRHVKRIPNTANPEMLYWFISPNELKDRAYVRDLELIAAKGTFDLAFLTQREGADFYDLPTMHPIFKDLVTRAHAKGLKVGLQLWPDEKRIPAGQTQGIVVEKELTLDVTGEADYTAQSKGVRMAGSPPVFIYPCVESELLHVYAFRKTTEGEYIPGSVIDITNRTHSTANTSCSITLHIG